MLTDEMIKDSLEVKWRKGNIKILLFFTVAITKKDGDVVYCKTKPMWSDYGGAKNKTWEYSNEKVTVAYNEERDKLIVLGKYGFKEVGDERDY